MSKQAILDKLDEDIEKAKKEGGKEIAARLTGIADALADTPDEQVEKFIDDRFDELKNLPNAGAAVRSYKDVNTKSGLASAFGYGGDGNGIDALFGRGKKNWKSYDHKTIAGIGVDNGFDKPEDFTALLERMQAEYDKEKQEERSAKMAEDIRNARKHVVNETLYPDWKKHPLDWITAGIAKTMFANVTESAREDALKGEGKYTTSNPILHPFNFASDAFEFAAKHPKDVLADAFITGSSMVPLGAIAARRRNLSRVGQVIGEGLWQGANTAAGELYGTIEHGKDFDYTAPLASLALGGLFEVSGKELADMFKKGFGNKSKSAKEGANLIEDVFVDKKELAEDYVKELNERSSKFETTDNPGRSDYKRTKDNYKETPITGEDVKKAEEARDLFDYIETGKRPEISSDEIVLGKNGVEEVGHVTREMTDKEIGEAFSRHPVLNDYSGVRMRDANPSKARTVAKFFVKNSPNVGKGVYKGVNYSKTNDEDRRNQELLRLQRLEKEFEKGNIPKTASDPNWKAYKDWAAKHPSKNDKAKILSFNY